MDPSPKAIWREMEGKYNLYHTIHIAEPAVFLDLDFSAVFYDGIKGAYFHATGIRIFLI